MINNSRISNAMEDYKNDEISLSDLKRELRRGGIEGDDGKFGSDKNSIEEKIKVMSKILIDLLVQQWKQGNLSDEELMEKADPYIH